jgi:hypothetical protein
VRVEEQSTDVLQNIEFGIVTARRESPDLTDHDVIRVLEALLDEYAAEKIGRAPRPATFSENERRLMERVRAMCDWRLGRGEKPVSPSLKLPDPTPLTIDEMMLCLKRLLRSVQKWNKHYGRRGYLDFIVQYVK